MEIWFVWLARAMYLGVFLIAGGMLYRAGRIALTRDLRYVADWRGRTMANPERHAHLVLAVNLLGGAALLAIGVAVLAVGLAFTVWTGAAGLVLWSYYFFLRVINARAEREGASS
ncbi:hypothetical protein EZJ19_11375 [Parasulfuritortus cantonensis]|uniref:DUF3784 domain-containing protein n=1 Tax=Parasulfuritortus cantonensis TaxID=2528202 RepID=A0A4R1B424_9PROT|nr:hypothetical protein [Parasulfuritortus cantonensis]TCJ12832.1 hypothetical protein EZJ19_11375 [Parasulfuritortus cantonensis]